LSFEPDRQENRAELEKVNLTSRSSTRPNLSQTRSPTFWRDIRGIRLENDMRDMRDRAYTLLRNIVNDIRECGKYVFYRDERRYRGYTSGYHRVSGRSPAVEEPADPPPASPVLPTQSA
jgi:hypothetical protein